MLANRISVVVVGCGGTGSAVLSSLPYLHHALLAAGHPSGLQVYVVDGDRISETNCVRQPFSSSEIGLYKVHALIQRLNVFWGLDWAAVPTHVRYGRDLPDSDFLISCVDTRTARANLARIVRLKSRRFHYWLDLGNNATSGQFVLGEPLRPNRKRPSKRLPCVDELFPQIVNAKLDARDSLPACSAAESLVRQEPYINGMLAQHALAMLSRLFRHGELAFHGGFVSQETGRVNPLSVDPHEWARIQSPARAYNKPILGVEAHASDRALFASQAARRRPFTYRQSGCTTNRSALRATGKQPITDRSDSVELDFGGLRMRQHVFLCRKNPQRPGSRK